MYVMFSFYPDKSYNIKKNREVEFTIPAILAITVARNSDIGLVCGFTRSAQVKADRLLRPEDRVLLIRKYVLVHDYVKI